MVMIKGSESRHHDDLNQKDTIAFGLFTLIFLYLDLPSKATNAFSCFLNKQPKLHRFEIAYGGAGEHLPVTGVSGAMTRAIP